MDRGGARGGAPPEVGAAASSGLRRRHSASLATQGPLGPDQRHAMSDDKYELIYHAGIPGRGEASFFTVLRRACFTECITSPELGRLLTLPRRCRSQFVRLFFEATGTPYVDTALVQGQSAVKPYLEGSFPGAGQQHSPPLPLCSLPSATLGLRNLRPANRTIVGGPFAPSQTRTRCRSRRRVSSTATS